MSDIIIPSVLSSLPNVSISSWDAFVNSTPEVKAIIDKGTSASTSELANVALLKAAFASGTQDLLLSSQKFNQLAALRVKINSGTATPLELSQYATAKANVLSSMLVNKTERESAEILTAAQAELKKSTLNRLLSNTKANSVIAADANSFYEYVIRTQALNPYSRERQCDRDFFSLITTIAADTGKSIEKAKRLAEMLKTAVKNSIKPTP